MYTNPRIFAGSTGINTHPPFAFIEPPDNQTLNVKCKQITQISKPPFFRIITPEITGWTITCAESPHCPEEKKSTRQAEKHGFENGHRLHAYAHMRARAACIKQQKKKREREANFKVPTETTCSFKVPTKTTSRHWQATTCSHPHPHLQETHTQTATQTRVRAERSHTHNANTH